MKTIKNAKNEIKRIDDQQAEIFVNSGDWKYIPKNEWKKIRKFTNESEKINEEKNTKGKKFKHDLDELQNQLSKTKSKNKKNTIERIIKKEKNK